MNRQTRYLDTSRRTPPESCEAMLFVAEPVKGFEEALRPLATLEMLDAFRYLGLIMVAFSEKSRYLTLTALGLAVMFCGCGRRPAQPASQSTGVDNGPTTASPLAVAPQSEEQIEATAGTEKPVAPSNLPQSEVDAADFTRVDRVEATNKGASPAALAAQVKPAAVPKHEAVQPTAEQLASWSRTPFEPVQLLACRQSAKTGLVAHLAQVPSGLEFVLAGTKVSLWSIDGTEPEHVFLDLANSGKELTIKSLAVSPNGKWFAAGDSEGLLTVWNLTDHKQIHSKKIFSNDITQIAISPDGQELAMISYGADVAIYQASTLEKKNQFKVTSSGLKRIEYVSPGKLAAAAETTTIWNTSTGKQEQVLSPGRYEYTLARSRDGKWFAYGDQDNLELWDVAQGKKANRIFPNIATEELVSFSPDGKFLVTANGSEVRIWDIATQQVVQVIDAVGWPIVGLNWLPETDVILVATVNGWTRIWGSTKSGGPLGLKPLHVAVTLPDPAAHEPASTQQWLQAIDFRSFPRLAGEKPMFAESSSLNYVAHSKLDEAKLFYQYHLTQSGWTEAASPSMALSPGSIEFNKSGFMLSVSLSSAEEGKTNVSLHNAGNYDVRLAPKIVGAPIVDGYSSASHLRYETKADLLQIETSLLRQMHAAGWTAYSRLNSSHNEEPDRRDIEFLRNGSVLRAFISRPATDQTSFHIQYGVSPIDHVLPIPKDSGFIEFDGNSDPRLVATTAMSLEQAREFYDKAMASDGWLADATGRSLTEEQNWLAYHRGQQNLLIGLIKQKDGRILIRVGDDLEKLSWQLEKPKPAPDPKSVAASIEAADFPILKAPKSAKFDDSAKSIELQFDATPMSDVIDRYTKELQAKGWAIQGSGVRSDEYTFLTFTKDKVEIEVRARSMKGNISVNIQGSGIAWTKALPGGKQIVSYEAWMRQNRKPASLEWLDAYKAEMQALISK